MKTIFCKLKYLVLFLSCFCFISSVNAEVKTFALSNVSYFDNNSRKNSSNYTSSTTNSVYTGLYMTSSKFTVTFNNDLSKYTEIGFELYDNFSEVTSNPNYNQPIMPLVIFDGYPCSVTPIGISSNSENYSYNGDEYALCQVKNASSNSHYIDIFTYKKPSDGNLFVGIHVNYFKAFNDDTSLKDIQDSISNTQKSVDDLNDNITSKDTTESQTQANSFFENFQTSDYGLSDIITMPLTLIKSLTNSTCVSLELTVPFVDKTLNLPCMSSIYSQYFGDFFTLYQLVIFGFVAYWVSVRIFNLVKDFKNPEHDEIEVLDL